MLKLLKQKYMIGASVFYSKEMSNVQTCSYFFTESFRLLAENWRKMSTEHRVFKWNACKQMIIWQKKDTNRAIIWFVIENQKVTKIKMLDMDGRRLWSN